MWQHGLGGPTETGKSYVMYYFNGGGYGGSRRSTAVDTGVRSRHIKDDADRKFSTQQFPIIFEEFSLSENSAGGAGRSRGGLRSAYASG